MNYKNHKNFTGKPATSLKLASCLVLAGVVSACSDSGSNQAGSAADLVTPVQAPTESAETVVIPQTEPAPVTTPDTAMVPAVEIPVVEAVSYTHLTLPTICSV